MISDTPFLCSSSYSYLVNYRIQFEMYDWLDANTEETKYLKLPGFAACSTSHFITLITRVAAVVEVFFLGIAQVLYAPLTDRFFENVKLGLIEIIVHTTKNVLRAFFVPIEFFLNTIYNFIEPKHLIMDMKECMKVNLEHAREDTIHSLKHIDDLRGVAGTVYPEFLAYQGRGFKRKRQKVNQS